MFQTYFETHKTCLVKIYYFNVYEISLLRFPSQGQLCLQGGMSSLWEFLQDLKKVTRTPNNVELITFSQKFLKHCKE